jgi:membrane associated rhomboid family serine protease
MHVIPFSSPPSRQPIFNLPTGIKRLALFLIAIHVARLFLSPARDAVLVSKLAFIPQNYDRLTGHALQPSDWPLLTSPITYMALHAGWAHLGFNLVSLLAFGSPVERLAGPWRMLMVFVLSGIGGALLQACFSGPEPVVLIGASGGISGLFAVAYLAYAPAQKLWQRLAALLVLGAGLVLTGLIGMPGIGPIAWAAHLGGFVTGLALVRLVKRPAS